MLSSYRVKVTDYRDNAIGYIDSSKKNASETERVWLYESNDPLNHTGWFVQRGMLDLVD